MDYRTLQGEWYADIQVNLNLNIRIVIEFTVNEDFCNSCKILYYETSIKKMGWGAFHGKMLIVTNIDESRIIENNEIDAYFRSQVRISKG